MTRNVGKLPMGGAGAPEVPAPESAEALVTTDPAVAALSTTEVSVDATLEHAESAQARGHRLTMGVLLGVVGAIMAVLAAFTHGPASFSLSDAMATVKLPTLTFPGVIAVVIGAVCCVAAAVALFVKGAPPKLRMALNILAGLTFVVGFLAWAAASQKAAAGMEPLPFQVSNQFFGTMAFATPLILGALAGVMGENAGVVNVSIEGQFLTAAFSAALVGTITKSLTAAIIAGMLTGVAMAALLALFSIKYLVDQVVLGVVLNLFASGLTGFLYTQFMSTNAAKYNLSPILNKIAIPGLSRIPFLGPILFDQTILAYLALLCIPLVWFLLYRTKWGLHVRAVGEHPEAADTVGLNIRAIRWQAVLVGGLLSGLGGTYFTVGVTGGFVKDMTAGNGFIALAALIMGRWKPGLAALMAVFFGFVRQLATQVNGLQGVPIDGQLLLLLPYIATIIAVAGLVGRVVAPKADGVNYVK